MGIEVWFLGRRDKEWEKRIDAYEKRINRYYPCIVRYLSARGSIKSTSGEITKRQEAEQVLKKMAPDDYLILLDERGREYSSVEFARKVQHWQTLRNKKIIFLIGGAYGFDKSVYNRMNDMFSLSKMTLSHQLVRLVFMEQLYRAFSILHGDPYHHE